MFFLGPFIRRRPLRRAILRAAFAGTLILFPAWLMAQPSESLSLDEAVRIAEREAPAIAARRAAAESAADAVGPAGQLPDPELIAGIDNLPVNKGDLRCSSACSS
jgi:cobalt-zinc-cadmium efflux system outer membrane protein